MLDNYLKMQTTIKFGTLPRWSRPKKMRKLEWHIYWCFLFPAGKREKRPKRGKNSIWRLGYFPQENFLVTIFQFSAGKYPTLPSLKRRSIVVAWLLSHEELKWYVFKTFFYIILSEQVFVSQLNLEWSRCWEICIRYFFLHPCWPLPQSVPHESAFCTVIWAISTLRNTFCTLQMQWLLLDTDLEWLEIH